MHEDEPLGTGLSVNRFGVTRTDTVDAWQANGRIIYGSQPDDNYLLTEYRQDDYVSSREEAARRDSDIVEVLVGVDWLLSGKSAFSLLVGGYQRDYRLGGSISGAAWTLAASYSPSRNWLFNLASSRHSIVAQAEASIDTLCTNHAIDGVYIIDQRWQWGMNANWIDTKFTFTEFEQSSIEKM